MFPTMNTFYRYQIGRLVESIEQAAASGIKTRILIYQTIKKGGKGKAKLQPIERHDSRKLQSKVTCLIVDSEFCLAVELKDDNASNSVDASGFATYSNSESTVAIYISISETLWMQSELQERN